MKPILTDTAILRQGKIRLPRNVFVELYDDHIEICDLKSGTIISRTGFSHMKNLRTRMQKLTFTNQGEKYSLVFAKHFLGITWAGPLFYIINSRTAHIWENALKNASESES